VTGEHRRLPRELAITDFRFAARVESVLSDRNGRRYLVYARSRAAKPAIHVLAEGEPELTRRLVEWTLGTLVGGFVATTIWFGFLVPSVPAASLATNGPASATNVRFAGRKGFSLSAMSELGSLSSAP